MQNRWIYLLLFLTLASCTTSPVTKRSYDEKLFPDGIYRQQVQLEIYKNAKLHTKFPFETVSKIQEGTFDILGLSPFGTSVFAAKGHLDHPADVQVEFFVERPEFLKDEFIKSTLAQINDLYRLKEKDLLKEEGRDVYKKENILMEIFKYNAQSIPSVIRITSPHWRAHVQNRSYKNNP